MNFTEMFKTVKRWFVKETTLTLNVSSQKEDKSMEFDWDLKSGIFTESLESKVIRLRKEGKTQKEIASKVGLTQNQVKGILKKLLESGSVERKRKYVSRDTSTMMDMRKAKKAREQFIDSRKNSKIVQKGLIDKDQLIDMSVAEGTIKMDSIDWVKKYNINVKKFKAFYLSHTCVETEKEFKLPKRVSSKIGKQLGISKVKPYTKKKVSTVD